MNLNEAIRRNEDYLGRRLTADEIEAMRECKDDFGRYPAPRNQMEIRFPNGAVRYLTARQLLDGVRKRDAVKRRTAR